MNVLQLPVLLLLCLGALVSSETPEVKCVSGKYPPDQSTHVPTYEIDLDLPPEQRWVKLATDKKQEVTNLVNVIKELATSILGPRIITYVDLLFPYLLKTLPDPYKSEIAGLANATGIPVGEVVLYNVFYELFTVCTSLIVKTEDGELLHARNLDFGLFLGWDVKNHTWKVTEALRPTVINLDFKKSNQTVFRAVSFAGYIGVLTAFKPGAFSLSMDERFNLNGGFIGIAEWIIGDRSMSWLSFLMRDVMEQAQSFEQAKDTIVNTKLLAPAYFILAGNQSDQACVLTKDRDSPKADIWTMADSGYEWFLVETNYDHWKNAPFFDDRRTPAINCLHNVTQKNADFAGIFDVLSSQPNLNKLTAYTALMNSKKNVLETYLQYCEDPCFPF